MADETLGMNETAGNGDGRTRHDGFRLRELWVATAIANDNQEALLDVPSVPALVLDLVPGPAFAADQRRLVRLREYARLCVDSGAIDAVTIRHLVVAEGDDEVIGEPVERVTRDDDVSS